MRTRGTIRARGAITSRSVSISGSSTASVKDGRSHSRATYKAAQKEMSRLLAAADEGTLQDPSTVTVAEYVRGFLDSSVTQSPKTLERYSELAERQVVPHLGAVKLQRLRPEHLERWHSELLESGLRRARSATPTVS